MKNLIKLIRGRIRIFWGLCPACNSDAPEKDTCKVCNNFYGYARNNRELKINWWKKFIQSLV